MFVSNGRAGLVIGAVAACVLIAGSGTAQAAVVASSLPPSADWTVSNAGAMSASPGSTTLTTAGYSGVWFGWGPASLYGYNPAWTPGDSAQGNYLSMTASFSANAEDWNTYLYDRSHFVGLAFAPTVGGFYGSGAQSGVTLTFAAGSQFVALADLTAPHTFEFLLKNGQVSYRIDGTAYTGAALAADPGFKLLVIGDGSGSTPTGVGSMTVSGLAFDNAPTADLLLTTATGGVPEPAAWALMILGFGLSGATLRRRRDALAG